VSSDASRLFVCVCGGAAPSAQSGRERSFGPTKVDGTVIERLLVDVAEADGAGSRADVAQVAKRQRVTDAKVDKLQREFKVLRAALMGDVGGSPAVQEALLPGQGSWGQAYIAAGETTKAAILWAVELNMITEREFTTADVVPPQAVEDGIKVATSLFTQGGQHAPRHAVIKAFQEQYAKILVERMQ
jgi:hypothetical protein